MLLEMFFNFEAYLFNKNRIECWRNSTEKAKRFMRLEHLSKFFVGLHSRAPDATLDTGLVIIKQHGKLFACLQ